MSFLYHGSCQSGLKKLEPHHSTHGNLVYATKYKELALIFSGKCGDDLTYTLFRNSDDEPWQIVERVPGAFSKMFKNESSIYTVSDATFHDIHTGFSEFVSKEGVDIQTEEKVLNVYDELKKLELQGVVKLYHYPNRPKEIPNHDEDLIEKQIRQTTRNHRKVSSKDFRRLLYLHPELLDAVNYKLSSDSSQHLFTKQDLVDNFENFVLQQMLFPDKDQMLILSINQYARVFPELLPKMQEKLSVLDKTKGEKINYFIDKFSKTLPDFPSSFVEKARDYYQKDGRIFSEIGREILDEYQKIQMMENLVNQDIDFNISDQSILFIGPMGTGKSTISKKIGHELIMPVISLDDREKLSQYYSQENAFPHFKDFEFYLTASVLTNLKMPSIIDFGAGHSVYENDFMFNEMKKLMSKFSNVVYLLPSQDKVECESVLNERLQKRENYSPSREKDNLHFLNSGCNEALATIREYTGNKTVDEISQEVLEKINTKNKLMKNGRSNIHTLKKQNPFSYGFSHFNFIFGAVIIIFLGILLIYFFW